jgi:hypothetical protein
MPVLRLAAKIVIVSLTLLIASLSGCGGGASAKDDAGVQETDGGTAADADTCVYPRGSRHWASPGCGAAQPPEPACGYVGMLGCYRGWICNCDGTIRGYCEEWSEKPWAYYVPFTGASPDGGMTSCDPTNPPPGAADGGFPN